MPRINCADCGSVYNAKRPNAKYCPFCRMYKDWAYAVGHGRVKKCLICEEEFWPVPVQNKVCSSCDSHPQSRGKGTCGVCKKEDQPFHSLGVKLCVHCVSSTDKKVRDAVRTQMRRKHDKMHRAPFQYPEQWHDLAYDPDTAPVI